MASKTLNAKRKRIALPPIASATRRILKKKPDGVVPWRDRVVENLLALASNPETPPGTAMHAIRTVIEQSGSAPVDASSASPFSFVDDGPSLGELRSKSKEELDKHIAELMSTVGSIPGVKAPETPA